MKGDVILFKRVSNSGNLIGRVIRAFPLFVQGFPEKYVPRTLFGSKWDSNELSLPVKMVDLLGEQLLTEVKPFLNMTLRSASALMLGVLQTELLYTWVSKPASSPIKTKTFFRSLENPRVEGAEKSKIDVKTNPCKGELNA